MRLQLTAEQYAMLLEQIPDYRVRQLRGQSHLEAWDVRRTLTRIFGFGGFDVETKALDLVREIEIPPGQLIRKRNNGDEYPNDKTLWTVVYRAEIRLVIKNPDGSIGAVFEDGASGDSANQPSLGDAHDQALKTALSQGLKRCAVNLGDQFGLALYNKGRTNAVVNRTLTPPAEVDVAAATNPLDETPVEGEPVPQPEPGPEPDPEPAGGTTAVPAESVGDQLAAQIAAATHKDALSAAWKAIGTAVSGGGISQQTAEQLGEVWKQHRAALAGKNPGNDPQRRKMMALFSSAERHAAELGDRQQRLAYVEDVIGRKVETTNELTDDEVQAVIAKLESFLRQQEPAGAMA